MIKIDGLYLQRGKKELFNDTSVLLPANKRIGFIGKNGSGKSSFFSLLLGEIVQDKGEIITAPIKQTYSIIRQETPSLECSAKDYVLSGDKERLLLLKELDRVINDNDALKIASINQKLEEINAYTAPARASKLLSGLGFVESDHELSVKSFSGGWRMRLNLAQALFTPADVLLLDEPTNHLDLETVLWLENYLVKQKNMQIIISHDRNFLNKVTQVTLELVNKKLTLYGGNYDFYEDEKIKKINLQENEYQKQQVHIKKLESFIDRFRYKASKARQAQSKIKALERMQKIYPFHLEKNLNFTFFPVGKLPNVILKFENLVIGHNNHPISNPISFRIESNARIGLLGVNGSGKSTLIKTIIGRIPKITGDIHYANKIKIGYFAQHQLDDLDVNSTALGHIKRIAPNESEQNLRNYLGGYQFSDNKVNEQIISFSGGEKARLALALIIWQKPNFLLLDEPTNHLDIDMRTALSLALQSYEGAMILVSHDRSLLESTCDQFIYIEEKNFYVLDGNIDDYQLKKNINKNENISKNNDNKNNDKQYNRRIQAKLRQTINDETKLLKEKIKKIEDEINHLEKQKEEINKFLLDEESYLDANKLILQENILLSQEINNKLSHLEEQWLIYQEKLENKKQEIIQQFR